MPYLTKGAAQIGIVEDENAIATVVQRAFADPAGIGDNQLVAAQGTGKKIRVFAASVMNNVSTAQNARFRSATNSIGPLIAFGAIADGEYILPFNPHGWFETNANEALN